MKDNNRIKNFDEGIELSLDTIKDKKAIKLLQEFVKETGNISKLTEFI